MSVKKNKIPPWRAKATGVEPEADDECIISRDLLLASRMASLRTTQSQQAAPAGLHTISAATLSEVLQRRKVSSSDSIPSPPGLESSKDVDLAARESRTSTTVSECSVTSKVSFEEPCLEPPADSIVTSRDSRTSTMASDCSETLPEDAASKEEPSQPEVYNVLLQNLPKAMLTGSKLRSLVKDANLQGVKKVAFKSDGRVLVTLATYLACQQCIAYFHGLPWFHAHHTFVPTVTATFVQTMQQKKASVDTNKPKVELQADSPSMAWSAKESTNSATNEVPGRKAREYARCSSRASTHSGMSSDEASCSSRSRCQSDASADLIRA